MHAKNMRGMTPVAAAVSAALTAPGAAIAQDEDGLKIEEIIVTARKREENLQSIPGSIQALPQTELERMGAIRLEDYARFIPSMSFVSTDAGQTEVIFRGVTTGGGYIAQSPSSVYFNSVALTTTGSQPDVRPVDIARIEALSGPQGTLYGGSAQSGTLRIVTNKPDPTRFEGIMDVSLTTGSNSSASHDVSAVLNIPLVEDKFAIRLVGYNATDGGFIDNVYAHTPDTHAWYPLQAETGTLDNAAVVEEDWNDIDYQGARISALWNINEDWSATFEYVYQNQEANGGNDYNPFVGDLQTVKFNEQYRNDKWDLFSLTIEADLGFAQLVSATGYYDRTIESQIDGTVYVKYYMGWNCNPYYFANAAFYNAPGYYYLIPDTGYSIYAPHYCFAPTIGGDVLVKQQGPAWQSKFTQELRLSSQGEKMDWIVGLYYEDASDDWDSRWGWPTSNDFQDSVAMRWWEQQYGVGFAPDAEYGWNAVGRSDWQQVAIFGEATWRLSDEWSATVGGRYFERTNNSSYYVENPATNLNPEFVGTGPVGARGTNSDFVPKLSVSWQVADDKMLYAMYTEGFRPGGINRGRGNYTVPLIYEADNVANTEIGMKTRWANGRVQFNVTAFYMDWSNYQLEVLDPSFYDGEPWQTVVANAGNAHTSGYTVEFAWVPAEGWEIGANANWAEAKNDSNVDLNGKIVDGEIAYELFKGSDLPNVPEVKGSAWATYSWPMSAVGGEAFIRAQYSHTGDSLNILRENSTGSANPQLTNHAYSILDINMGLVAGSGWEVNLFVKNVTDERAELFNGVGFMEAPFSSVQDGIDGWGRIYTNRPREYGIRFKMSWGD